jgi:hypothetical protein
LLGNHHVGVDIDDLQRRGYAFEGSEFFHRFFGFTYRVVQK